MRVEALWSLELKSRWALRAYVLSIHGSSVINRKDDRYYHYIGREDVHVQAALYKEVI